MHDIGAKRAPECKGLTAESEAGQRRRGRGQKRRLLATILVVLAPLRRSREITRQAQAGMLDKREKPTGGAARRAGPRLARLLSRSRLRVEQTPQRRRLPATNLQKQHRSLPESIGASSVSQPHRRPRPRPRRASRCRPKSIGALANVTANVLLRRAAQAPERVQRPPVSRKRKVGRRACAVHRRINKARRLRAGLCGRLSTQDRCCGTMFPPAKWTGCP